MTIVADDNLFHWQVQRPGRELRPLCVLQRRAVRARGVVVLKPRLRDVIGAGYGPAHEATFRECPTCKRRGEELYIPESDA